MAVYAIGDVQGCLYELVQLLEQLNFDLERDEVWFAGDLVNRGPQSADTLRFIRSLGRNAKVVLGNHDLHLVAQAAGIKEHQHRLDTIDNVLTADDADELICWLRKQPLFHHDAALGFSMVHAGLPPQWTIAEAMERAAEVSAVLRSDDWQDFFHHMYGNKPKYWSATLTGWDRLRYITNCFTRLRYCHHDGALALKFKGSPEARPDGQQPWFAMPNRASANDRIVFGHWSQLGTGQYGNAFSLDSGAVWGEKLTALRLDALPWQWTEVIAHPSGRVIQTPLSRAKVMD
ncbi:Bis(5'-nucleosyl)-tetraphosphatase, symmetrical [Methylophaga frappieri]|uniref:Bis(5'-nucleosyl)-tetraphosphatase, symmetrical n=1 Tax=Methylophaga frappieri (strain ATCC BAA-2434 / DSM 25690 / JAM7) TaxID=754477 RepID=I1YGM9_METFJ|nr:symmetrical bis(5'-nucleosyl)-tetraphosphatase [Methylophaga frappieri]AFJ02072.1 Bis(5'-nucleosyl)-tetraphosphatase, symmetrical [Methylophaga frappieri]